MFFVINKKTIGIFVILLVAVLLIIFTLSHFSQSEDIDGFSLPVTNKVIVIDAGHGGVDAGASDNGLSEKELNLAIAKYLRGYIEQSGGIAVMTREEDVGTHNPDRKDGTSQKKSDLTERKKMSDEFSADAFVSIHMNKFPQEKYKGAQVFYAKEPQSSKLLAESIQQSIKDTLKDDNERVAKPDERGIFILKDVNSPSVIVECGFLSNKEEAELLKTEEYQQKIAWGIYLGIVKFLL